jgi:hypothetical protein
MQSYSALLDWTWFLSNKRRRVFTVFSIAVFVAWSLFTSMITTGATNDSSEPSEFYFILPADREHALMQKYSALKIGDEVKEVIKELGQPTLDQIVSDKKGVFIARVITYAIRIKERNLTNEKYDKYVRLEFDKSDKLTRKAITGN